jgi:RND superfamily putative drug exporter
MRGAAVVTILGVLVVMLASVTLFPALLGYLGKHIDRLRLPLGRFMGGGHQITVAAGGHVEPSRAWLGWSRLVDRHRIVAAVVGTAALLALAAPFLGVQFGFPDAGNNREETSTRQAYDMLADGFGPGMNGPLLLVAELPPGSDASALDGVSQAVSATPGVVAVAPATLNETGDAAVMTVVPATGPQDQESEDLIRTLRDDVLPQATAGGDVSVYVGGVTATSIDSTDNITKRLPLLIGGVVLLSMLLLIASFRSLAVAVKAAVMNLLSVAAAYGIMTAIFQTDTGAHLLGLPHAVPVSSWVPILMFTVLFGLSMDYDVFILTRTKEVWDRTRDNT